MKDDLSISIRLVWYSLLTFGVLTALGFATYALQPTWLGFERKNFVTSHQYIEAKRSHLRTLVNEYDANETEIARFNVVDPVKYADVVAGLKTQQASLISQLRAEVGTLPSSEVPFDVFRIINGK